MTDAVRDILLAFMRVHVLHHAVQDRVFGVGMMDELARHGYKRALHGLAAPLICPDLPGLSLSHCSGL
jgi:PadR family transcriptional regulator, regulatory protein PadR